MSSELTESIHSLALEYLESRGLDLIELKVSQHGKTTVIDILADKPDGGITIDECTSINKSIYQEIENNGIMNSEFVVQVASPGLDRPLITNKDFMRVRGRTVRFHLKEPINNKLEYSGDIVDIKDKEVDVQTKKEKLTIPLDYIIKAVQVIDFENL